MQRRFDELVMKRQARTVTPEELAELVGITNQIEQHDVQRVVALDERARLRGISLANLVESLGMWKASGFGRPHMPDQCITSELRQRVIERAP